MQKIKIKSLLTIEQFIKYVKQQYECKIKIIQFNSKVTLHEEFKTETADEKLIIEKSLFYTQTLNEAVKRSNEIIIIKFCCLQIAANLSENL